MSDPLNKTLQFFDSARATPGPKDFQAQLSKHLEEFGEMLETLASPNIRTQVVLETLAGAVHNACEHLKTPVDRSVVVTDEVAFFDSVLDQTVTSIGLGQARGYDVYGGLNEVANSNLSKLGPDGLFIKLNDGTITKGPDYRPPNLTPYLVR